jgi:hypothetical protein
VPGNCFGKGYRGATLADLQKHWFHSDLMRIDVSEDLFRGFSQSADFSVPTASINLNSLRGLFRQV